MKDKRKVLSVIIASVVMATSASAGERFTGSMSLNGVPKVNPLDSDLLNMAIANERARNGDTFGQSTTTNYNTTTSTNIGCQNNVSATVTFGSAFAGKNTPTTTTQTTTCQNSGNGSATVNH